VEAIAGKVTGPSRPVLIDGGGHIPHLQAGERVFSEMVNFISGLVQG
jgi:pimeloyl-ACP methyl ester carboxylesterase